MANVKFKISSALKTIIGKELITDDFIAMFELVKNSFDANAKRVDIRFEALGTKDAKIVIQDNGDGMDKDDITGKWLFVAYSAKKKQQDYRDKIGGGRVFAGAKGIGRFSCDRLGEELTMYSKKRGQKGAWNVLKVNWSNFEVDAEKEFQNIPAQYTTQDTIPYDIKHGTVLEIKALRAPDWEREKLMRLRRSLERLVNPNQGNDADNFQIWLSCPAQVAEDNAARQKAEKSGRDVQSWELVNGRIHNFVFENLDLKTSQIVVEVAPDGETIHTRLTDRGRLIYDITEKSRFGIALADVRITLFALNRAAKMAFSKAMGMRVFDYGSIFLYKNGFRINPFGDPGDDRFGIDARHLSGFFRTFGNRDLSGRIEINGPNQAFQETSSRDGGLFKNQAFFELRDLLLDIAVERLERFAIDVAKFGPDTGDMPDVDSLSKKEVKQAIFGIITKLTGSAEVLRIEYDPDFLNILENSSADSVSALLGNLKRIAAQENSPQIVKEVAKAERQLKRLTKAKQEAEKGESQARERAKKAEDQARLAMARAQEAEEVAKKATVVAQQAKYREEQLDTQNVFLKAALSKDLEHVLSLHHSIQQDALTIELAVYNALEELPKQTSGGTGAIKVYLEQINNLARRIGVVAQYATKARNPAAQEEIEDGNLIEFIREYLLNVHGGLISKPDRTTIPIRFEQNGHKVFRFTFSPIDVTMVLENLISNSKKPKHRVQHVLVRVLSCDKSQLRISFSDDGVGVPKRDMPMLFELGFSTTDGSGMGLRHARQILSEMGSSIDFNPKHKPGAEFLLTFNAQ